MSTHSSAAVSPIALVVEAIKATWNELVEVVGTLLGLLGFLAMLSFGMHGL